MMDGAPWSGFELSEEAIARIVAASAKAGKGGRRPPLIVDSPRLRARLAKIAWEYLRIKSNQVRPNPTKAKSYFDGIVAAADKLIDAIEGPDPANGRRPHRPWNLAPWGAVNVPDRPAEIDDFAQVLWWREAALRGSGVAQRDIGKAGGYAGDVALRALVGELAAIWRSCGGEPGVSQRPRPDGPFFRFCKAAIAEMDLLDPDNPGIFIVADGTLARSIKDIRSKSTRKKN